MITKGKVVSLSYVLKDDGGEELDRADGTEPFTYIHGIGQIVPGLESALEGLAPGAKKSVKVPPKEGYGEVNASLKMSIDRDRFPKGADIKEGMQFQADVGNGQHVVFTVQSISGKNINVDGNHPLAGKTLHFEVEVIELRDATSEEMAHGHVHGPGGHHHH